MSYINFLPDKTMSDAHKIITAEYMYGGEHQKFL